MHLNSLLLFRKYALANFQSNQRVMEVGPSGYPSFFQKTVGNDSIIWDTLDITTDFDFGLGAIENPGCTSSN